MSKEDNELRTALEAMVRDIKANGKRTTIEELFEEEPFEEQVWNKPVTEWEFIREDVELSGFPKGELVKWVKEDVELYKSIATLVELGKAIEEQHPNFFDEGMLEEVIQTVRTNKEFIDYINSLSDDELLADLLANGFEIEDENK